MIFTEAITEATKKVLKKSKKNLLFGLEITNTGVGFYENFPKQVFETPVSELANTGLVVGLSTKGYRPQIVYGRLEFAMLAFDQIFTQASRWEYVFGEKYKCLASFRIQIGRQWGNGPQHTANYHSIFLQSANLDIFIPSTPSEAYKHIVYMSQNNRPSVMLEHRFLSLTNENFKIPKRIKKLETTKIYKNKKKTEILIITYADTLINSLKAKEILEKNDLHVCILNFSYFPAKKRVGIKDLKFIKKFKHILFVDSAPFEFGILSGISSIISMNSKNINYYYLSPPPKPAPSSPILMKEYYINQNDIVKKVIKILNKENIKLNKLSFDDIILWPKDNINKLKK